MHTDLLRRYLSEKVSQIQDESMLLALKTIVDKELAFGPAPVKAEQDRTPDTPAPDGQSDADGSHEGDPENQGDEPILDKVLNENKEKKAIEDWLKNL